MALNTFKCSSLSKLSTKGYFGEYSLHYRLYLNSSFHAIQRAVLRLLKDATVWHCKAHLNKQPLWENSGIPCNFL